MQRHAALELILTFSADIEAAYSALAELGYDPNAKPFVLTKSLLADVLTLYVTQAITVDALAQWVLFVECRDDINDEAVEDYIYFLGNTDLSNDFSFTTAQKILSLLSA